MIFTYRELVGIKTGKVTLAFRKWKKPAVKPGGTQKSEMGVVRFDEISQVPIKSITDREARKAGFENREELLSLLSKYRDGKLYKIKLAYHSEDPRLELRERTSLPDHEFKILRKKLDRLDAGKKGPWTLKYLRMINRYPERRAGDLADMIKMDKFEFKINVRKLKNLGLTVSHEIGYSVSPLGNWVMENWNRT